MASSKDKKNKDADMDWVGDGVAAGIGMMKGMEAVAGVAAEAVREGCLRRDDSRDQKGVLFCDLVLKSMISDKTVQDSARARAHYALGVAYTNRKELDAAIADFDEAIRLNPQYVEAFLGRGEAYKARGDLDRARKDFDKASELGPQLRGGKE